MSRTLQIAVADDEPDMRDFLKRVLERLGHEVLGPVENGLQLVDLALAAEPDLIITDVRMPVLSGDEAIRKIHASLPVPCIVLSAFGQQEVMAFEAPHVRWAFLGKPFRKNDLEAAIRGLMGVDGPADPDAEEPGEDEFRG
jgi:response regulator NasT